jgi:soluble lytic murein transglycosylase-like protein
LAPVHDERRGRGFFVRAAAGALAICLAAGAVAAVALALGFGDRTGLELEEITLARQARAAANPASDPFAWSAAREDDLEAQAATGSSHVIYELSPGGVVASAERTARWRDEVERAAVEHGVDPDTLEAIIFLESAGRPDVSAGPTPEAASGLAQILPSTATDLLGMQVDLARSIELTKRIANSKTAEQAERLRAERAAIDQRFDPRAAINGAARYLQVASERFGDDELAVVSYHMGIGNLETVLRAYADAGDDVPARELVEEEGLTYARVFFGASPIVQRDAHDLLTGFGDDSSLYLWKVRESERIMALYRRDREELERTAELAIQKATLEEVFHPESETDVFESPDEIEDALADGDLAELPTEPALGWVADKQLGEMAPELDRERELYRALRPEALATLSYMSGLVLDLSNEPSPLRVTSAVRDLEYQGLLVGVNPEATREYSLHTTGWSFDIRREYASKRQAAAFQYVLDRLSALALIDYAVEPGAIHVTVSELGERLVD